MAYELATKALVASLVLGAVACSISPSKAVVRQVPAVYVFGDSMLDVGNNNYLPGKNVPRANMPYHGIDMPGSGKPTGRFSNGYNTADFVAMTMGFDSSPPPYLSLESSPGRLVLAALTTGVSYASSGAGILDSTNAGNNIPLSRQVRYFGTTRSKMVANNGSDAVSALLSRSVFLMDFGGNDLAAFTRSAEQRSDAAAFYGSLVSNYSAAITELYTMGARKLAIINLGLTGCLPIARVLDAEGACLDNRNELAGGFNGALRSMLASLAPKLPGLVYSLAVFYGVMTATFTDPQASGFTDVASGCCGSGRLGAGGCAPTSSVCANRDRHYFWDGIHQNQRAASLKVRAFYDGPAQYTTPINFKQLSRIQMSFP